MLRIARLLLCGLVLPQDSISGLFLVVVKDLIQISVLADVKAHCTEEFCFSQRVLLLVDWLARSECEAVAIVVAVNFSVCSMGRIVVLQLVPRPADMAIPFLIPTPIAKWQIT